MHIAVNLGVQKIASFQVDNFLPEEIDHELNIAMDRFIKQRYNPMSNRYQKGFEQSQKRIDDLRHLIATTTLDTFSDGEAEFGEDSLFFSDRAALPNDYLFLVNLRASIIDACEPTTFSLNSSENQFQRISLTPPVIGYILTGIKIYLDDDETLVAHSATGLTKDELLRMIRKIPEYKLEFREEERFSASAAALASTGSLSQRSGPQKEHGAGVESEQRLRTACCTKKKGA